MSTRDRGHQFLVGFVVVAVAGLVLLVAPLVLESAPGMVPAQDGRTSEDAGVDGPALPPSDEALAAEPTEGPPTEVRLGEEVAWIDGVPVPYSPASAFVLPGEPLHIDVQQEPGAQRIVRADSAGTLQELGADSWVWTAPHDPGVHTLRVVNGEGPADLVLRAFVMEPAHALRDGRLNGYRIGRYPREPLRGDTMYIRPEGFVEVTEENRDLRISPRFRLKHFETKQGGGFPRYVVLQRKLLTKLELVVDALVERGYEVSSLHVMSGYRTPAYNRQIGNVQYSRHQWGDASDIFVDEDGNGWMDDLNDDGRVDRADARVLYEVVDSLDRALDTRRLLGGLGIYGANSRRGPFVHVDTRGRIARW